LDICVAIAEERGEIDGVDGDIEEETELDETGCRGRLEGMADAE
jgi:hypothetical protein